MVRLLQLQRDLGCDILTDGELRRDNFYSFVAEKLEGVRLMTLAEMLDVVAALAARRDPAEELEFAVALINQPLAPYLERLDVAQLVLEYATDRAGDVMLFGGKELGLGVVNPRTEAVESSAAIRAAVEGALRSYAPGQILFESRLRLQHVLNTADEYRRDRRSESGGDGCRRSFTSRAVRLKADTTFSRSVRLQPGRAG